MADSTQLKKDAAIIRDAEQENSNTAYRVGKMLLDIIDAFSVALKAATAANDGYMSAAQAKLLADLNKSLQSVSQIVQKDLVPLNKPATDSNNGFMTAAQVSELHSLSQTMNDVENIVANRLLPRDVAATAKNDGYMTMQHVAKINETESYLLGLDQTVYQDLIPLNVPATSSNDGFMTAEQADFVEEFANERLIAEETADSFSVVMERGAMPNLEIKLPVHGSDNLANRDCPALINRDAFLTLSTVMKKWPLFDTLLAYVPTNIMDMIPIQLRDVIDETYSGKAHLVYSTVDNQFLALVYTPSGHELYYRYCDTLPDAGYRPQKGKIYLFQNQTFIGTDSGLCELFSTVE